MPQNNDPKTIARSMPLVGVSRPALRTSKRQEAIFVIDTSGSMTGEKINDLNAAVVGCVTELAQLKNRGMFLASYIIYGDRAQTIFTRKPAGDLRPDELTVAVGTAGTNTNLGAGLTDALALVEKTERGWLRPVVILMTDGRNTMGPDPVGIAQQIKAKADLIGCGFGADADMALLGALATSNEQAFPCRDGAALRKFFMNVGASLSIAAHTGQKVTAILGMSKAKQG